MITLAGNASTNSRGHRPLPPSAVSAKTLLTNNTNELVQFTYADGHTERRDLLSWVGGQSGLLWGGGPYPIEIRDAIRRGAGVMQGSYGHAAEWALADALGAALDSVFTSNDLACRFYQDGGTPLAAAARLARHATGKMLLASVGYHGAAEEWAHRPSTKGIPDAAVNGHARFEWGDVDLVQRVARHCAAICVEVPPVPDDEARAFLQAVRQACDAGGAVFILDEVVTGFRLGLQGAAGYYGVKPDIACYGKAMSATGCISAIVGRADLVEPIGGEVFLSTTFGGNPGQCAVAAATIEWLTANQIEVYGGERRWGELDGAGEMQHHHEARPGELRRIGQALKDGLASLGLTVIGQPERSVVTFPTDAEWLTWCGQMIERGVMVHRPQFPTLNHTDSDVDFTLRQAADIAGVRL